MSEWKALSSITSKIGSGSTPRGGNSVYSDSGISFIRSQNVLDMDFSTENLAFINDNQAEKLNNVIVEKNDILLNITGDSIARCTVVPEEILPARVNQHVSIIRCKNTEESKYVMYYLQYMKKYLLQISKVGGTRNALTKEAIGKLPIKISDECNEISKILDNIDQKIQINNQINQELEAMAKTLYDYWFVQFDFPDQNGKPYKSSGGKMVYNPELKREIPEGWGVTKLNEVVDLISGYPFSSNDYVTSGKYKLYTIKNVQDGYTVDKVDNYLDFLPSNMSDECQLRRGDLIMSLTGNVGRVGMVYEDDVLLNQRVLKLNPINKTHKSFIYSFFRSDVTKAHLENMSTGTSQKNLSPIDIGNMMIPFPSESLLSKFVNNLNMLENNLVENQQLTQLRDWLLPMLMNGQVKVE